MGVKTDRSISFDQKIVSGSDLSSKIGYACYINTTLTLGGDDTGLYCIFDGGAASGDYCEFGIGECWMVPGGAVSQGAELVSDSSGKMVTSTSGKHPVAIALSAANGSDTNPTLKVYIRGRRDDEATA